MAPRTRKKPSPFRDPGEDFSIVTPSGRITKEARNVINAAKQASEHFKNKLFADMYVFAIERMAIQEDRNYLKFLKNLKQPPVSIEEFLDSKEFLGATDLSLWPAVREAVIAINKDWWKGTKYGAFSEAVLAGSTACGKSELIKITFMYHLHILGCMKSPQKYWGLPEATSIVFLLQSAKPAVTKNVLYLPLRSYILTMPWFQRYMRMDKYVEAEMLFPDYNVRISPGGSDTDAVLGEALISSAVDEINFFDVVQRSKRAALGTGRDGTYDAAQQLYNTVTRRKTSRFPERGPHVGVMLFSSSTRYKNDFTDRRIAEVKKLQDRNTYVYNKARYEAQPADRFCGEVFRLHISNNAAMDLRILEDHEKTPAGGETIEVPVEFLKQFKQDPSGALRDIVGRSANSINPFFKSPGKILSCVQAGKEAGLESFLHNDNIVLAYEGLPLPIKGTYCKNPTKPRYVHIDLALNQCRVGIVMLRVDGIEYKERSTGEQELLPVVSMEMAVSIEPDKSNEIDLSEIRSWVKLLKTHYGYPIKVITYDGHNSVESRQQWQKQGFLTGMVPIDRSSKFYKTLRDALYDRRILMFEQQLLLDELFALEYDEKKDKVDHPIGGSKDIADSLCCAYWTLLQRMSSWAPQFHAQQGVYSEDRFDPEEERYDSGERS